LLLQGWGWEVIPAENGRKVLEKYQAENPDLILMDLQMPELDGLNATRMIREQEAGSDSRVPIMAFTAHARREEREKCLDAGMDDLLTKPIDMEKLHSLILRYL
jgi:CheY-like chemotaxis protein